MHACSLAGQMFAARGGDGGMLELKFATYYIQSSKSPLTGFLCSIGWRNHWPDQTFFQHSQHSKLARV